MNSEDSKVDVILVLEGFNDLQFFRSFLIKSLNYKNVTNDKIQVRTQFTGILQRNPGGARVDIVRNTKNNQLVALVSTGGKQYLLDIAQASKAIINRIVNSKIMYIGDIDAKEYIESAVSKTTEAKISLGINFQVQGMMYNGHLEDLILKVTDLIKSNLSQRDKNALNEMLSILDVRYSDESTHPSEKIKSNFKKRKTSIVHAIVGPRCWGHLFDTIFETLPKDKIDQIDELKSIREFLET